MSIKKIRNILLQLLVFVIVLSISLHLREYLADVGILQERISIAGTGSMYPTFPKGKGTSDIVRAQETVAWPKMKRYPAGLQVLRFALFASKIGRGDIVSFANSKTDELAKKHYGASAGFVKRVIAVAGDTIQIRDGYVLVNDSTLKEPYTAKPRSTYGGSFLSDCKTLKIPSNKVFVMGDNRKGSLDSRHDLGLISVSDIDHFIPLSEQEGELKSKWRDVNKDLATAGKSSLDVSQYLLLLNQKRKEAGLSTLTYSAILQESARKRANVILTYDDLSFEASKSGYTMEKALQDVGHETIIWGEAPVLGYYDAQELIENYFQFPETKKFLLDKDFQETGVATFVGQINNCPTQVVVQHLTGYVPPNYQAKDIEGWRKLRLELERILPGWEKAREYKEFYNSNKDKLERIITIIHTRIDHSSAIIAQMEKNLWLNKQEKQFINDDASLGEEQEKLATELNKQ